MKLLVVDDDPKFRQFMQDGLEVHGIESTIARRLNVRVHTFSMETEASLHAGIAQSARHCGMGLAYGLARWEGDE